MNRKISGVGPLAILVGALTILGILVPALYWLISLEYNVKYLKEKVEELSKNSGGQDNKQIQSLSEKLSKSEKDLSHDIISLKKSLEKQLSEAMESVKNFEQMLSLQGGGKAVVEDFQKRLGEINKQQDTLKKALDMLQNIQRNVNLVDLNARLESLKKAEVQAKEILQRAEQESKTILEEIKVLKEKKRKIDGAEQERDGIKIELLKRKVKLTKQTVRQRCMYNTDADVELLFFQVIDENQSKIDYSFKVIRGYNSPDALIGLKLDISKDNHFYDSDGNKYEFYQAEGILQDKGERTQGKTVPTNSETRGSVIFKGSIDNLTKIETLSLTFKWDGDGKWAPVFYTFVFKNIDVSQQE